MTYPTVNTPDGSVCPHCGASAPVAAAIALGADLPRGSVVFCTSCGSPSVLTDDLAPRMPTEEEMTVFEGDEAYQAAREVIEHFRKLQQTIALMRRRHTLS